MNMDDIKKNAKFIFLQAQLQMIANEIGLTDKQIKEAELNMKEELKLSMEFCWV